MNKGRVHFCLLYLNPEENGNTSVERFSGNLVDLLF